MSERLDEAARRTRDTINDYDQAVQFCRIAEIAEWSTPEKRGRARGERDAALIRVLGATECLLEIIGQEKCQP